MNVFYIGLFIEIKSLSGTKHVYNVLDYPLERKSYFSFSTKSL